MSNRNFELMKSTIILSIGQVVPKLLAIFVLPILTAFLTKRDYGLYELTLSVASFCIPLLSVQIQQGVFRFLLDSKNKKERIIASSFWFIVLSFIFFSIPLVIAWSMYTNDVLLGILFFISYFSEVLLSWSSQTVRGFGDNMSYSDAYIIYSIIYIVLLFMFILLTKSLTVQEVAIAMVIAYFLSFVFLVIRKKLFLYIAIKNCQKSILIMLLKYSAPMVISSVALWIVNLSDRFFVSGFLGIEMAAVYSVANRIPNLFNSVYNIFNLAWTENTSRLSEEEKREGYYTQFFKEFYQVMVGMILVLMTLTPIMFTVLINRKYAEAYSLMSWLYVGVFFSSLVSFFGSIYIGEKRTMDVGVSSAIGALINVVINLLFMKSFGVVIAAFSTIVSFLVICIYRAIDIKKYVRISYDLGSIIIGSFFVCGIAVVNNTKSVVSFIISLIIAIGYNIVFNKSIVMRIESIIKNKIRRIEE